MIVCAYINSTCNLNRSLCHTCPEYRWQKPRIIFSLYMFPAAVSILLIVCICSYSTNASSRVTVTLFEGPVSSRCRRKGWNKIILYNPQLLSLLSNLSNSVKFKFLFLSTRVADSYMETVITNHMHIAKLRLWKYSNTVCEIYTFECIQSLPLFQMLLLLHSSSLMM